MNASQTGGRYENVSAYNYCGGCCVHGGINVGSYCGCQTFWLRATRRCGTMVRPWMGMGAWVGRFILCSILLPVLSLLLCGAAGSYPATARGLCSTGPTGRADILLVFLQGPARLLSVCKPVSERLDEGCADTSSFTFNSAKIKG